jgi:hypothetical protein
MKEIGIYSKSRLKSGRERCSYYQKGERWFSLVRGTVVLEYHKRLCVAAVTKYRCVHDQNPVVKFPTRILNSMHILNCSGYSISHQRNSSSSTLITYSF